VEFTEFRESLGKQGSCTGLTSNADHLLLDKLARAIAFLESRGTGVGALLLNQTTRDCHGQLRGKTALNGALAISVCQHRVV
jgi:hypothetical protein